MHPVPAGWDPLGAPHSHPIPPTVEAVIATRIDHLPPEAREVIRRFRALSPDDQQALIEFLKQL